MTRKWPLFKGFERNHNLQNETQTIIDHFWSEQSIYSIKEESLLKTTFRVQVKNTLSKQWPVVHYQVGHANSKCW